MPDSPKKLLKAFEPIRGDLEKAFGNLAKSIYKDKDTYSGSWPTRVTREQAKKHILAHSEGKIEHWHDFVREVGDKPTYHKDKVLGWLGY